MDQPFISVVIPTYNRKDILLRSLDGLRQQAYPSTRFEAIVVDDGSSDGTEHALQVERYPFELRHLRQSNRGATIARNKGAECSHGMYLVFMDDDIVPGAKTLEVLVAELRQHPRTVVLGTLCLPREVIERSPFAKYSAQNMLHQHIEGFIPFQECMTGLLAIERSVFFELGMFQDPSGGWPNWDDVDFGFRAAQAGIAIWRSALAIADHWDYSAADLKVACQRWYRASKSAPSLFKTHPTLMSNIPMFLDKGPIIWRQDSARLILRKLARQLASARLGIRIMECAVQPLERHAPESKPLALLYRWITSGYIFRGYRAGIAQLEHQNDDSNQSPE